MSRQLLDSEAIKQHAAPGLDGEDCPSLASGDSSRNTDNSDHLTDGGPSVDTVKVRFYSTDRWVAQDLCDEAFPLCFGSTSRGRLWHLQDRLDKIIQSYRPRITDDESSSATALAVELVDKGNGRRGRPVKGSGIASGRITKQPSGPPGYQLCKEITDPGGADESKLLLGYGVYNAKYGHWEFKCYWFKHDPIAHQICAEYHAQEERNIRRCEHVSDTPLVQLAFITNPGRMSVVMRGIILIRVILPRSSWRTWIGFICWLELGLPI